MRSLSGAGAEARDDAAIGLHDQPLLVAEGIAKSFNGVPALRDGRLTVKRGTVHALCGGNGAGKSTFLNIVMGLLHRDEGSIRIEESPSTSEVPPMLSGMALR